MKAVTFKKTMTKNVDIDTPVPHKDELLIKVKFSALDTALDPVINKTFLGGMLHKLTNPLFCGWHYCGIVKRVGDGVPTSDFQVGSEVFGHLPYGPDNRQGSLAEYVTVKFDTCALKPENVGPDVAAAASTEVSTALQALRDKGGLVNNQEQSVLINGAGGGVGTAAVQIAKRMGARVTAICSTKDIEKVKKIGADVVVDRKKVSNVLSAFEPKQFDIILDTANALPAIKSLSFLKSRGRVVLTAPEPRHIGGMLRAKISKKGYKMIMVKSKKDDLDLIANWLDDGFKIDIDSTFQVRDIDKAVIRNRDKGKKGRVVVQVENGW